MGNSTTGDAFLLKLIKYREINGKKLNYQNYQSALACTVSTSMTTVDYWEPSQTTQHTHHGGVFNFDFTTDGSVLVAACERRSLLLFDPLNHTLIGSRENAHSDCVNYVRFLDSRTFATCSDDKTIALWDLRYLKTKIQTLRGHSNWVKNIEYSNKTGLLMSSGFDGSIYIWDINRYNEGGTKGEEVFNTSCLMRSKLTPDGSTLVISTGGTGYLIVVHDLDLRSLKADLKGFNPSMPLYTLLQPNTDIAKCNMYNTNRIFEQKRNRVRILKEFPLDNDPEMISSLQVHPQGWCVVSRNSDSDENSEWTCIHDIQDYTVMSQDDNDVTTDNDVIEESDQMPQKLGSQVQITSQHSGVYGNSRTLRTMNDASVSLVLRQPTQSEDNNTEVGYSSTDIELQTTGIQTRELQIVPNFSNDNGPENNTSSFSNNDNNTTPLSEDYTTPRSNNRTPHNIMTPHRGNEDDGNYHSITEANTPDIYSTNGDEYIIEEFTSISTPSPIANSGNTDPQNPHTDNEQDDVNSHSDSEDTVPCYASTDRESVPHNDSREITSISDEDIVEAFTATSRTTSSPIAYSGNTDPQNHITPHTDNEQDNVNSHSDSEDIVPCYDSTNSREITPHSDEYIVESFTSSSTTSSPVSINTPPSTSSFLFRTATGTSQGESGALTIKAQSRTRRTRLTHYIEEPAAGRGFIKELCFSNDGRLIISPFAFGVRILSFDMFCNELCDCVPDSPVKLYEVATDISHTKEVVSTKYSPTHHLFVSGCLNGRVSFHQPRF